MLEQGGDESRAPASSRLCQRAGAARKREKAIAAIGAADGRTDEGIDVELRYLRAFLAVARTGGFTAAGARLSYAQSTITEQIRALETELGATLFDRTARGVRLTPAGERLVAYAEQVLALAGEARAAVREGAEPAGTLLAGGLETLCAQVLPGLLVRYREACPRVRVVVRTGTRGELVEQVRRGDLAACLTFGPVAADAALVSRELHRVRLVVVGPPGHPVAATGRVSRADLAGERFLATEPGCGFRAMFDAALGGPAGPELVAEVGSMAALRSCARDGVGLALLPEVAVAEQAARGEVTAVPLADPDGAGDATVPVLLTWAAASAREPALAGFLAVASPPG